MEMFSEIDILKFAELTLLSWIFMEYEILYKEKIILVNVLSTSREGRLADKIKNVLLMYTAWMIPVLRNVLYINECYVQATRSVYFYVLRYVQKHPLCGQVTSCFLSCNIYI
jgi:hypothetical protein